MNISHLDADALYLILLDLTSGPKRELLALTDIGPRALPRIEEATERLSVLVQDGKPFAAELAAADKIHDVGAVALDMLCDMHSLLATLPQLAHLAPPAEEVRAAFTMGRGHARASYVTEAAEAARNRAALPGVIDLLRAMPITDGFSGADLAELYIGGGESVRAFLTKRADVDAAAAAARRGGVLNAVIEARGLILRLRGTIEAEVSWRDDLDDSLPLRIFSVLDGRLAAAAARTRRNAAGAADVAEEEGVGLDGSALVEQAERHADGSQAEAPAAAAPGQDPTDRPDAG